jgi:flagellar basal body P-ring formation protein FlgA
MARGSARSTTGRAGLAALLGLAAALAAAPMAWAGRPVALKPEVSSGATVTLGDLFDGAGTAARVVVGNGAPPGQNAVLDAAVVREMARQHGLDWDNPDAIARIVVPRAHPPTPGARMVETLTYARSIATGELIAPEDLTFAKVAAFAVPPDAPRDADEIIGKVAKRPLKSGGAVAVHDVASAQVIKTNDLVQVTYRADGVSLVLQGKALGSAAVGEPVDIMNTASKKVIQAVATGADEAVVGPEADQIRARPPFNPAQIAALR